MRLKKAKQGMALEVYERRKARIRKRLDEFIDQEWKQKHARRLQKRLRRHREELLTFLDHDEVPPDNNGGERGIRPAVLIRKNSYGNGSERGAQTQAVMMTIMRTLKMRGHNPVQILIKARYKAFLQGKTASFFVVALCVAPFFRFRFSPYGAIPEAGTRLPAMQHLDLEHHAMRCLRLGGMCQVGASACPVSPVAPVA